MDEDALYYLREYVDEKFDDLRKEISELEDQIFKLEHPGLFEESEDY